MSPSLPPLSSHQIPEGGRARGSTFVHKDCSEQAEIIAQPMMTNRNENGTVPSESQNKSGISKQALSETGSPNETRPRGSDFEHACLHRKAVVKGVGPGGRRKAASGPWEAMGKKKVHFPQPLPAMHDGFEVRRTPVLPACVPRAACHNLVSGPD